MLLLVGMLGLAEAFVLDILLGASPPVPHQARPARRLAHARRDTSA
ncbi:hypothetical protein [Streptomyces sp. enrichment culture]